MLAQSAPSLPSCFEILKEVAQTIERGQEAAARGWLASLPTLEPQKNPDHLKAYLFLKAFEKKLGNHIEHQGNLYLSDFECKQIDLFNLLATKLPFVTMAASIANDFILSCIQGVNAVTLIDIGIGTGRQEVELLKKLQSLNALPEKLTIIGIEPSQGSLDEAARTIGALSATLPSQIHFEGICAPAESLTAKQWHHLSTFQNIIVNEAFSLHHVNGEESDWGDKKDEVIWRVHQLRPLGFVLAEPHSDHHTHRFVTRFHNAWKHFGLAFDVIDGLDITPNQKSAMKFHFFGREIEDILGERDEVRSERHETAQMWKERLTGAGFQLSNQAPFVPCDSPLVTARWHDGYLGLETQGEVVVSLMLARG